MVKLQFLGKSPIDFDGFPKKVERTFSGALHLKPNKVYEISEQEYSCIKKARPELKFHEFKKEQKFVRPVVKVEEPQKVEPKVEPKAEVKTTVKEKTSKSKMDKKKNK